MQTPVYPAKKRMPITSDWKELVTQPNGTKNEHNGLDFSVREFINTGRKSDRENYATLNGVVTDARNIKGLGCFYKIYYSEINQTQIGGHLAEVAVKKDDVVKAGQVVAYFGEAPSQTIAIHFHYQLRDGKDSTSVYPIRIDSRSINPFGLLKNARLKSELATVPVPTQPQTPPVVINPPVVFTPPIVEVPVDYKQLYTTAINSHTEYVITTNTTINGLKDEIKKLEEQRGEYMNTVGFTGDVSNFRFELERLKHDLEEAQKNDYRNIISIYITKLIHWLQWKLKSLVKKG